uniref:Uncharacterized protein n=1 Tax=Rhizophora mucronata TaxID=61149 RepID=A0A2P2QU27_RHIMU
MTAQVKILSPPNSLSQISIKFGADSSSFQPPSS